MFDDAVPKQQGSVPSNLPIGETPEDMFAGVDGNAPTTALDAGVLTPKETPPTRPTERPTEPPRIHVPPVQPAADDYDVKGPTAMKTIMILVGVILVLAIVGGGGWFVWSKISGSVDNGDTQEQTTPVAPVFETVTPPVEIVPAPPDTSIVPPATTPEISSTTTSTNPQDDEILFGDVPDTDDDGLDDVRESDLGTNPNHWDTDEDGLSDGDEVNIWKTQPKNPDSDGDTYPDGAEVKNGYNPAGPGKIFNTAPAVSP